MTTETTTNVTINYVSELPFKDTKTPCGERFLEGRKNYLASGIPGKPNSHIWYREMKEAEESDLADALTSQIYEIARSTGKLDDIEQFSLGTTFTDLIRLSGMDLYVLKDIEARKAKAENKMLFLEEYIEYFTSEFGDEKKSHEELSMQYVAMGYRSVGKRESEYQRVKSTELSDAFLLTEGDTLYFGMIGSYMLGMTFHWINYILLQEYELSAVEYAQENGLEVKFIDEVMATANPSGVYYPNDLANKWTDAEFAEAFNISLAAHVKMWHKAHHSEDIEMPTFTLNSPLIDVFKYSKMLDYYENKIQRELKHLQPVKFISKLIEDMDKYVRHSTSTHTFYDDWYGKPKDLKNIGYKTSFYTTDDFTILEKKGREFAHTSRYDNQFVGGFNVFFRGVAYAYIRPKLKIMLDRAEKGEEVIYIPVFNEAATKSEEKLQPVAQPVAKTTNGTFKALPKITFHGAPGELVNLMKILEEKNWLTIPAKTATAKAKYLLDTYSFDNGDTPTEAYLRQLFSDAKPTNKGCETFNKTPERKI